MKCFLLNNYVTLTFFKSSSCKFINDVTYVQCTMYKYNIIIIIIADIFEK